MDQPPPAYLQQPTNNKKSDNRMKRHPELQPYVPSDRDKITSLVPIRKVPTGSNSKPKACSSLTSSLTSNTNTTTSTNNTTTTTNTNNYRAIKAKDTKPRNQPIASTTNNTKPTVKARPVPHQQPKKNGCSQLSSSSASPITHDQGKTYVVSAHEPAAVSATASTTTPATVTPLTGATRKLSNASINNTSTSASDETSIEQLNETNGDVTIRSNNSGSKANTPAAEQVTPEKPVATIKIEPCDDKDNSNSSAIDNQMSDLSINERLYQSAASDLSQEISEVSTNGNYHENNVSLLHDLEAELIAEGIVKTEPVTPKLSMSLVSGDEESIRRESTPEIKSPAHRNDKLEMLFKKDEEKRLKAEEELRENARRMEEERQSRQSLIESILSKVNQSS